MKADEVISRIRQLAASVLPAGSALYLYGSRARGDFHEGSDWDNYSWPFIELGLDIGEDISARTFTRQQWFNGQHTLFYYNVEEDKQILYES